MKKGFISILVVAIIGVLLTVLALAGQDASEKKEAIRYRLQHHLNPNYLTIHLDKMMTEDSIRRFENVTWEKERPIFVKEIFQSIPGIREITLGKYEVGLNKGEVFSWYEITDKVLLILKNHLSGTEMKEIASPLRPCKEPAKQAGKKNI